MPHMLSWAQFRLGNALGVDADARQLAKAAVVLSTAHIGAGSSKGGEL